MASFLSFLLMALISLTVTVLGDPAMLPKASGYRCAPAVERISPGSPRVLPALCILPFSDLPSRLLLPLVSLPSIPCIPLVGCHIIFSPTYGVYTSRIARVTPLGAAWWGVDCIGGVQMKAETGKDARMVWANRQPTNSSQHGGLLSGVRTQVSVGWLLR